MLTCKRLSSSNKVSLSRTLFDYHAPRSENPGEEDDIHDNVFMISFILWHSDTTRGMEMRDGIYGLHQIKTQWSFSFSVGEVPRVNLGQTQTIELFFPSNKRNKLAKFPSGLIRCDHLSAWWGKLEIWLGEKIKKGRFGLLKRSESSTEDSVMMSAVWDNDVQTVFWKMHG